MKTKSKAGLGVQKEYESRIGRIAMYFPLIHFLLEDYAWKLWGLAPEFGKILTKDLPTKRLVEKIVASLNELEGQEDVITELKQILKSADKLAERRNELFHSMLIVKDGKPVLISRKQPSGDLPAPELRNLEELFNSVVELIEQLSDFSRRNLLLGALGLATRKKYGKSGAKPMPKHPVTG